MDRGRNGPERSLSVEPVGNVWLALACGILLSCAAGETNVSEEKDALEEKDVLEEKDARIVFELPIEESQPAEFMDESEVHSYPVALESGDFLHVEIEQRGVDVVVSLADPDGKVLIKVDSPGGTHSTERLGYVVSDKGTFEVQVRPGGPLRGRRYSIRAEAPRTADDSDVEYARACEAMSTGDELRAEGSKSSLERGLERYESARRIWLSRNEIPQQAIAWHRAAMIREKEGRINLAEDHCLNALAVLDRAAGQASQDVTAVEVDVLLRLAIVYRKMAQPEKAIEMIEEARCLAHQIGNWSSEANALTSLATISFHIGRYEDALRYYRQTERAYRELEIPSNLAIALRKAGDIYILLGSPREAWSDYQESLAAAREAANQTSIGKALIGIGWYHYYEGEFERALDPFTEAIDVAHKSNDAELLAAALDRQGSVYLALGRLEEALNSHSEALRVCEEKELIQSQGAVLVNLGLVHLAAGRPKEALATIRRALPIVRQMNDQATEADGLLRMAMAERELGLWDEALSHGAMALDLIESLRSDIRDPDDRLLFLEQPRQVFYEFNVDLMIEQSSLTNDEAYESRAFEVAEKNRARVLLELLGEARSEARREDPLNLERVQRLLDPETTVLTFFLGEERSFLWRIGHDEFDTHVLPSRMEIEGVARKLCSALERSHEARMRGPARLYTEKLSRMVLGDAERALTNKRLVIVADGALQYVPFAALVKPSSLVPLVVDHEIVTLPSASVLAALREKKAVSPSLWSVAVIADPVTDLTDERLRGLASAPNDHGTGPGAYPRLEFAQAEAEAIVSFLPEERARLVEAFEASLETVTSGTFRNFEVVHFAAHGNLDTERPERSAIVLSLYDGDGRPREGLLSLEEIYTLDLSAELVVLSACNTALGREVRGEGLVGLTRGFMYAGASRVLVSLWEISDNGTAELMKRFYRRMLTGGELPAAALRAVQRSMLEDPVFQAPYYWAPFVFQGDWR